MLRRDTEAFKNPIHLVRPLTVNPNRRVDRAVNNVDDNAKKHRPKTGGIEVSKKDADFQSNSSSTNFSFTSDYDTDLDDDVEQIDEDDMCIGIYKRVCRVEKLVPVKTYLENYKAKELSLRFYGLGPRSMRAFVPSLTMNQYITKLDLASNGLGDEGVVYLAHILRDNVALNDIDLSQNFIGIDGARELCNLFKENHIKITHLKLDGNLLDDKCAPLFAEMISSAGQFNTLNLARNKFGSSSGIYLGPALAENISIQSLDLSWNSINGKGGVALIKGVQKNEYLQALSLAHNGLSGGECGRAWLQAFKENKTLAELDLSHNRLTAEPATYIGRGLAKSESLQSISLTGNPLETAGCYAILKPLIAKTVVPNKLHQIDLTEIMINRDFHELYVQVAAKRPELRILIGLKVVPPLVKDGQRASTTPMERLHILFQRRPQFDLTKFFFSVAGGSEETMDSRITNHVLLKQSLQEKLNAEFLDEEIENILKEISEYDYKRFMQIFEKKPTTGSSSSWRLKS